MPDTEATILKPKGVNWWQWAFTALPVIVAWAIGLIGLWRTIETRQMMQEERLINAVRVVEGNSQRIAELEKVSTRDNERLATVMATTQEIRSDIRAIRQALARMGRDGGAY